MKRLFVRKFFDKVDSVYERQLQRDTSSIQDFCFRVSFSLFGFVVLLFILASVGFIVHIGISAAYFWVALLMALVVLVYKNPHKFLALMVFLGVVVAAFLVSFLYYDHSWDGRAYHQIGIYYLANGWNPVYQKMAEVTELGVFLSHEIWVEHYLKFAEIAAACIYKAFGFIEIGKAINYIFAFACFLYGVQVLLKLPYITITRAFLFAFLLAFCPVVLVQISTYYLDGLLCCALCMVFLGILDLEIQPTKAKYCLFILALVATASIKLTGVAYAGFVGIAYLVYKFICFGLKESKPLIIVGIMSAFVIALCNFNPFFTNLIDSKHPGYPLLGKNKIDIITGQQPQNFKDFNRFEKMFYSLFSKTYNGRDTTEFKIPFFKTSGEHLVGTDTRVAGFGYYFGGIITLCMLFVFIHYKELRTHSKALLAITLVLGSVFINPESWWARYAPQLWIVPFILLIASYGLGGSYNKPFRSLFRVLVIWLLILSVWAAGKSAIQSSKGYTKRIKGMFNGGGGEMQYIHFESHSKMERSFIIKAQEQGYRFEIIDEQQYQKLMERGHQFEAIPGLLVPGGYWDMKPESTTIDSIIEPKATSAQGDSL